MQPPVELLIDGECEDVGGRWSLPQSIDGSGFGDSRDGDHELRATLLNNAVRMGNPLSMMCAAADIIAAKAVNLKDDSDIKTQVLTFSKEDGLDCDDDDQPGSEECNNYAVSYCCKSKINIYSANNFLSSI